MDKGFEQELLTAGQQILCINQPILSIATFKFLKNIIVIQRSVWWSHSSLHFPKMTSQHNNGFGTYCVQAWKWKYAEIQTIFLLCTHIEMVSSIDGFWTWLDEKEGWYKWAQVFLQAMKMETLNMEGQNSFEKAEVRLILSYSQ